MISAKTKIVALIGDPVEHSISPQIHNAAFQEMGLDYVYVTFNVSTSDVKEAMNGIRSLGIKGVNITIPHKIAVLDFMDELHGSASDVGAVNTIKNEDGSLIGFNTDGEGALRALENEIGKVDDKSILLLGAGGAARAILFSLLKAGANVTISNRTASKARNLASSISDKMNFDIDWIELKKDKLIERINDSDILINTTSVGMEPNTGDTLVTADMMTSNLIVNDIVYNPIDTRLLKEAEQAGAKTIDGLDMLTHQGAASFEIWTGNKPPIKVMRKAAVKAIRGG